MVYSYVSFVKSKCKSVIIGCSLLMYAHHYPFCVQREPFLFLERDLTCIRYFFLKKFCRAHSHVLFWGHWYPCFGFLVTSHLGFKARVGSALYALRR